MQYLQMLIYKIPENTCFIFIEQCKFYYKKSLLDNIFYSCKSVNIFMTTFVMRLNAQKFYVFTNSVLFDVFIKLKGTQIKILIYFYLILIFLTLRPCSNGITISSSACIIIIFDLMELMLL
jgi:hypothetical protein